MDFSLSKGQILPDFYKYRLGLFNKKRLFFINFPSEKLIFFPELPHEFYFYNP